MIPINKHYEYLKKITLVILIVPMIFSIAGCGNNKTSSENISHLLQYNDSNITKIVFKDGTGINEPFALESRKDIDLFLKKYLDGIIVQRKAKQEKTTGYIRSIVLYKGNKTSYQIVFANGIKIENVSYNVKKGNLSTRQIDDFILSVNPHWKPYS